MVSIKTLSILAIAGSAIAAPHGGYGGKGPVVYETEVAVATVVVTVEAGAPAYTPPPQKQNHPHPPPPPPQQHTPKPQPPPQQTPKPQPPPPPPAQTPKPQPTPAPQPPSTGGYMDIVNEYRQRLDLPPLTVDHQLEQNAEKTCRDGNGEMKHELNTPTMAQVLAPGKLSEFKHIFVGGWLCEKPDMAGLKGECATQSSGWYYTSTGHADILTSKDYKYIGCGSDGRITGCDLR